MKKIHLLGIALVLLFAVTIASSWMGEDEVSAEKSEGAFGDVRWSFDDTNGSLVISGTGDLPDNAYNSVWNNFAIKSITLNEGVTGIGSYAFFGCTGVKEITIPQSVTTIGEFPFNGYTIFEKIDVASEIALNSIPNVSLLKTVILRDGMTSINDLAFYGCTGLTEITIPSSVKTIGNQAFSGCTGLSKITMSSNVTSVGHGIFSGCTGLTEVIISSSLSTIGGSMFSGCTGLTEVIIPSSVEIIEEWAFQDCTDLSEIVIPSSVKTIGDLAFSGCTSLKEIVIPSSVINMGYAVFNGCDFEKIDVASEIALNSMLKTSSLKTVILREGITNIGESAFLGCTGLIEITIPSSVTTIENGAFHGCTSLKEIMIPSSVTTIDYTAFMECSFETIDVSTDIALASVARTTDLKVAILRMGVVSISINAFEGCTNLAEITIPSSVTSVGPFAFWDCTSLVEIKIPSSVTKIEMGLFYGCTKLTKIELPSSIVEIQDYAFYRCTKLKEITIPSSVLRIGNYAFEGCTSLSDITIPSSVIDVGVLAFKDCTFLTNVVILSSDISLNYDTFSGSNNIETIEACSDNALASIPKTKLKTVILNEGVTNISYNAFDGCTTLVQVTISASVTHIYDYAFRGCTGLREIIISSSVTQIGKQAFCLGSENKIVNCKVYADKEGILDEFGNEYTLFEYIFGTEGVYTVTFNGYATPIVVSAEYASPVIIPDVNPAKTSTNDKQYEFKGWKGYTDGMRVTKSLTFEPIFETILIIGPDDINADENGIITVGDINSEEIGVSKDIVRIVKDKVSETSETTHLEVESQNGTIKFGPDVINFLNRWMNDSSERNMLTTSIIVIDSSLLNSMTKEVVKDRPVYNITINNIENFDGGKLFIGLKYDLKEGEDVDNIEIWCVSASGSIEKFDCTYEDGYVYFETEHLSYYCVAYVVDDSDEGFPMIYILIGVAVAVLVIVAAVLIKRH